MSLSVVKTGIRFSTTRSVVRVGRATEEATEQIDMLLRRTRHDLLGCLLAKDEPSLPLGKPLGVLGPAPSSIEHLGSNVDLPAHPDGCHGGQHQLRCWIIPEQGNLELKRPRPIAEDEVCISERPRENVLSGASE
jgi:hypothetical protein